MKKTFLLTCAVATLLLIACLRSFGDGSLHVYFLNVGQGDAILAVLPTGEKILVDGGPNATVLNELSSVLSFYDGTIDVIVLTHPHADHVNGLVDVMRRFEVRQVLLTGAAYGDPGYEEFLDSVAGGGAMKVFGDGKHDYRLGGAVLDMLYPFESVQGKTYENINNSSIVFRLIYGENIIYLNGDAEVEVENALVESGLDLDADIYKAGHHGSRTSNSLPLLELIEPGAGVISCGEGNSFGHPHAETLKKFHELNMEIYRTDIDGRIHIVADREKIAGIYRDG